MTETLTAHLCEIVDDLDERQPASRWLVYLAVFEHGPCPYSKIVAHTPVSESTIAEALSDLDGLGLIARRQRPDRPGRPEWVAVVS